MEGGGRERDSEGEDQSMEPKRKKQFTISEVLQKLEETNKNVSDAAECIAKELCPFDVTDEEAMMLEDRAERLQQQTTKISKKLYKIQADFKARKFRKKPAMLEEKAFSSSQSSLFDSEPLHDALQEALQEAEDQKRGGQANRPTVYNKKPLAHEIAQKSRKRRVAAIRDLLEQAAREECGGITVTSLLGYLLHLENYNGGDRSIAATGWMIFCGETVKEKPEVTVEEAIWMIETGSISQLVWQEFRLRLLDRIRLPPVNSVRAENQKHRPTLMEYKHGVRASLVECLSLSLTERLQYIDVSGLDSAERQIFFTFSWGLDGSGDQRDYNQLSKTDFSTKQVTVLHCRALHCTALHCTSCKYHTGDECVPGTS